jgi:hypothetical protein
MPISPPLSRHPVGRGTSTSMHYARRELFSRIKENTRAYCTVTRMLGARGMISTKFFFFFFFFGDHTQQYTIFYGATQKHLTTFVFSTSDEKIFEWLILIFAVIITLY